MDHAADIKKYPSGTTPPSDNNMNLFDIKRKNVLRYRFDFEVGYLIKSPCRECRSCSHLPGCTDDCVMLEKIQTVLAESISCTRRS